MARASPPPAAFLRRMQALEAPRWRPHERPGVMLVPPILPLDEWERLAMESQAALARDAAEDRTDWRKPK